MRYIVFFLVVVVSFETLALLAIGIRLRWALNKIIEHVSRIAHAEQWIESVRKITETQTYILKGMNREIKRLYALNSIAAIERATPDLFSANATKRRVSRTLIESSLPIIKDGLPDHYQKFYDASHEAFKVADEHFDAPTRQGESPAPSMTDLMVPPETIDIPTDLPVETTP